jgi:hypothetical protein
MSINVKINMDGVQERKLPSPGRFLELQSVTDRRDIEELTKHALTGRKQLFIEKLKSKYYKTQEDAEFMWLNYNDLIFKFVVLSVSID